MSFQPLSYLPGAAEYIDAQVGVFQHRLSMFRIAVGKPHALSTGSLEQSLVQHRALLTEARVPQKQLLRWQRDALTPGERAEVDRLVSQMKRWRTLCQQIIELVMKLLEQNATYRPDAQAAAAFYIEVQCRPYGSMHAQTRQILPFVLPPDIAVSRKNAGDTLIYAFEHQELGFLGQLAVQAAGDGVMVETQVNATPENGSQAAWPARRKRLLEDLTHRLMAGLGDVQVSPGTPLSNGHGPAPTMTAEPVASEPAPIRHDILALDHNGLCTCRDVAPCASCSFCRPQDTTAGRKALCEKITLYLVSFPFYQNAIMQAVQKLFPAKRAYDDEKDICTMLFEAVLFEDTHTGVTPLSYFVDHAPLSPDEKRLYEAWRTYTRYGFFPVEKVVPGRELEVSSLHGEERYRIFENKATRTVREGSVIMARLVPFLQGWMITTETVLSYPGDRAARQKLRQSYGPNVGQFAFVQQYHEDRKRWRRG